MRRAVLAAAVVALVASFGCSSSGDDAGEDAGDDDGTSVDTTGATDDVDVATTTARDEPAGGDVDCAAIRSAAEQVGVPIQLMAQVRDPSSVETFENGPVGQIDVDAFLAGIEGLRVLEAHPTELGSVTESLDAYQGAGEALKELFEADSVTQADVDAFNAEHIGTIGEFLGHQVAISASLDEAGC